jgi:hypothetical protein
MIPINRTGRILSGEQHAGWLIRVEPADASGDSFLVLYFTDDRMQGFDDWVQDYDNLMGLFDHKQLVVNWDIPQPSPT